MHGTLINCLKSRAFHITLSDMWLANVLYRIIRAENSWPQKPLTGWFASPRAHNCIIDPWDLWAILHLLVPTISYGGTQRFLLMHSYGIWEKIVAWFIISPIMVVICLRSIATENCYIAGSILKCHWECLWLHIIKPNILAYNPNLGGTMPPNGIQKGYGLYKTHPKVSVLGVFPDVIGGCPVIPRGRA